MGMAIALEFNRVNKRAQFALVTDRSQNEGWSQMKPVISLKSSSFLTYLRGFYCVLMVNHLAGISPSCITALTAMARAYKGALCVYEQEVNLCFGCLKFKSAERGTGNLNVNMLMTVSETLVYTTWTFINV